jgi:hypothetical protein
MLLQDRLSVRPVLIQRLIFVVFCIKHSAQHVDEFHEIGIQNNNNNNNNNNSNNVY